jgi:3'-phosphoadenosine 5'-phosphosulfate sulfotransferase (PAPS reductase)/FAD synthetase
MPNLAQLQSLPVEAKVVKSQQSIKEWYEYWQGNVYISFSGGKDSLVLLNLVRNLYPEVPAVFVNTGLEFPEITAFVRTVPNVEWLHPKHNFKWVVERYGYPVIYKEQASYLYECRTGKTEKTRQARLQYNKWKGGKVKNKYLYLLDAPFKISHMCCNVLKENPILRYERRTKRKAYLGTLAEESQRRKTDFSRYGCNSFESTRPISRPLSFWLDADVWWFITINGIEYSPIYNMGWKRTGCYGCMFGVHFEEEPNRFQRLAVTHPKLHDYCINRLGEGKVLDYIGVKYD